MELLIVVTTLGPFTAVAAEEGNSDSSEASSGRDGLRLDSLFKDCSSPCVTISDCFCECLLRENMTTDISITEKAKFQAINQQNGNVKNQFIKKYEYNTGVQITIFLFVHEISHFFDD